MDNAKIVLYSRTRTKDYHWIFIDDTMEESEKRFILSDLKNNKILGLKKKYLIVRELHNKLIFYRIIKTGNIDMYSREICALQGIVFSGINYDIIKRLLPYEVAFAFCFQLDSIDWDRNKTINVVENISSPVFVSIDLIIEKYKNSKCISAMAQVIKKFICQNSNSDFIVTQDSIIAIDGFNFQANISNIQSFDDLLDNIGKTQDVTLKNSMIEKKGHLCCNNLYDFVKRICGVKSDK